MNSPETIKQIDRAVSLQIEEQSDDISSLGEDVNNIKETLIQINTRLDYPSQNGQSIDQASFHKLQKELEVLSGKLASMAPYDDDGTHNTTLSTDDAELLQDIAEASADNLKEDENEPQEDIDRPHNDEDDIEALSNDGTESPEETEEIEEADEASAMEDQSEPQEENAPQNDEDDKDNRE